MGVVDLALGPDGTQVALKRLTLHGSAEDIRRARQRIEREAAILSRLVHPNIVPLIEVVEEGDEVTLVMPYLPGGSLSDRVTRDGPVPAPELLRLAEQVGGALAAAHRAGVVHRDIKPANVLFDSEGSPHLADFGVASSRSDTVGLTATGTVVGTPGFMAPEQARGEDAGQAADVFALGATLLFAATGEGPYGRGAPDLLMVRAAQGKVRPVPRYLPLDVRHSLEGMLDARAERRPSAAAVVGGPHGTAVRARVARRRLRRGPTRAALAGLGAVAVAVAGVAVASRDAGDPPAETGSSTSTTDACVALPYQPCGAAGPAPNTDGSVCLAGFDDYDGRAPNGCEAEPDGLVDGTALEGSLEATIVPRDDVDRFTLHVSDNRQLLCDGRLVVTLTAPTGASLRLEVLAGDEVLRQATSADGVPAAVSLDEPGCFSDDSTTLVARVSPIGSDRSGAPYRLERRGSY